MARVWVLSATRGQRSQFEALIADFVASISWLPQPFTPGTYQCIHQLDCDPAWLSSELAKIAAPFEVEAESELFLFHPGLGIHRQEVDLAGEPLLRVSQVQQLVRESQGSLVEMERLLRLAKGQPWLDLLEPYRLGLVRAEQLPRAV